MLDQTQWKNKVRTTIKPHFCFQGYKYAATQARVYCFCGNEEYDRYGKSTNCGLPCPGNPDQKCGGVWANMVFEIGKDISILCYPILTNLSQMKILKDCKW